MFCYLYESDAASERDLILYFYMLSKFGIICCMVKECEGK